jgi:glycosyltransferase involved in cell wall biosynthesis
MAKWSLSYVLPVHNDECRLAANVARLVEHLRGYESSEILLVENGSSDRSWSVAESLAGTHDGVPVLAFREPNAGIGYAYARALAELETRHGPDASRWAVLTGSDLPFGFSDLDSAKPLLDSGRAPVIIGSKAHPESVAFRSRMRQGMSLGFRVLRRVIAGMRTGDSQGSIFMRLDVALPLAKRIESRNFFYTTELVYYAEALPDGVIEVPAVIEASQLVRGATSVRAFSDSRAMLVQLLALRGRARR